MASHSRDGVNPLRPYYIPPSIGEQSQQLQHSQPNPFRSAAHDGPYSGYASKARDIFPDLDYKDYISDASPSTIQSVKDLIDDLLWKYTSVLMAQPFEVAKTILQVRSQDDVGGLEKLDTQRGMMSPVVEEAPGLGLLSPRQSIYDEYGDDDSDADEPAYFTSNVPYATPTPSTRSRNRIPSPLQSPKLAKPVPPQHHLTLRRPDSLSAVISQLWSHEGAWGVWKGTNATFLYTVLSSLLENWTRSLFSAMLNVPDLGLQGDAERVLDLASPYPWVSLFVAAAAAAFTGLALAPLDLVRTRLVITSTSRQPRRTMAIIRSLPSWFCPTSLIVPTVLHSLVHPLITLSTPIALRSGVDGRRQPPASPFSVAKLTASCISLFLKLPLETALRRGQVAVLSSPEYLRALDSEGRMMLLVQPGKYAGVYGTIQHIVMEEGSRELKPRVKPATKGKKGKNRDKVAEAVYKRGQGLEGLWRGWKVSWWGLVGLWTAGIVGAGGEGEF